MLCPQNYKVAACRREVKFMQHHNLQQGHNLHQQQTDLYKKICSTCQQLLHSLEGKVLHQNCKGAVSILIGSPNSYKIFLAMFPTRSYNSSYITIDDLRNNCARSPSNQPIICMKLVTSNQLSVHVCEIVANAVKCLNTFPAFVHQLRPFEEERKFLRTTPEASVVTHAVIKIQVCRKGCRVLHLGTTLVTTYCELRPKYPQPKKVRVTYLLTF